MYLFWCNTCGCKFETIYYWCEIVNCDWFKKDAEAVIESLQRLIKCWYEEN